MQLKKMQFFNALEPLLVINIQTDFQTNQIKQQSISKINDDNTKFLTLGAKPEHTKVMNNLKFDIAKPE